MSKANTWEYKLLDLLFLNADATNIGNAGGLLGSTVAGDLYFSMHTGDPDEAGDQTSNETAYTGYDRVAVARSGANFTRTLNSVSPNANIDFPECSASPGGDLTYFGVGTDAHPAAGNLLYSGLLTPAIAMAVGVIPRLKTTTAITED